MEDIIRLRLAHDILDRERVAQIAIEQRDAVAAIDASDNGFEIVQRAAPPEHAVDIPIGILQQELGKVGAHHAGDSGNQALLGLAIDPSRRDIASLRPYQMTPRPLRKARNCSVI